MEEQKIPIYKTKEYIKQYNQNYYENNKTRILEYQYKKTACKYCGCFVAKFYMNNHMKTNKCKRLRSMISEDNSKNLENDKITQLELKINELEQKMNVKYI